MENDKNSGLFHRRVNTANPNHDLKRSFDKDVELLKAAAEKGVEEAEMIFTTTVAIVYIVS